MFDGKGNDAEEPVVDKVSVKVGARLNLQSLCDQAALVEEEHSIFLASGVYIAGIKHSEQFLEKGGVELDVTDNVDLVEEDERVEHGKGRIVQDARQDHILEVLQSPRASDFSANHWIPDGNDFLEA